jgi:predicted ATPase
MTQTALTIACTGTHCSGKSTLTNALAKRLQLDPINISRPTTAAQQLGYAKAADVPQDQVQTFQWMGLFEQIHQERIRLERPLQTRNAARYNPTPGSVPFTEHVELLNPGFVSDRAVIDFLAYYQYRLGEDTNFESYEDVVKTYAHRYSAILYLPPNPNGVEDDNRRFVEGTEQIDKNITKILGMWSKGLPPVITVPWLPIEERTNFVIDELTRLKLI